MRTRYKARFASSDADVLAVQTLRGQVFRGKSAGLDADAFDQQCQHMMVEDGRQDGRLVCVFRIQPFANGSEIERSYSAQYYELSALQNYQGKLVEMGRFCIDPAYNDPDILRVAWSAMTAYVDDNNVEMLFGCSSFHGVDADNYMDAFALLKERHLAPKRWLPRVKAPSVFSFARKLALMKPNLKTARKMMPPLLRTYLVMGGWVSDHAVVDRDLNTLHVFTGLEIGAIPANRKRLLRAVVG
ncbi:MAG: GNAT family N-acetyltransferase [Rhodobacteraceae bacterium]|nr:GNAT family N-acetyltransferase [Paracoccaceae bacterium]